MCIVCTAIAAKRIASPAPKALMSMNATPASATSVRVSWTYSADPSTLTIRGGYRIQYTAVSPPGLSDAGNLAVTRLSSSYIIYGLEEGVRYEVTVNAYVGSTNGAPMSTYVSTYTAGMLFYLLIYCTTHMFYIILWITDSMPERGKMFDSPVKQSFSTWRQQM